MPNTQYPMDLSFDRSRTTHHPPSTINHQISQRGLLSQGPRVFREDYFEGKTITEEEPITNALYPISNGCKFRSEQNHPPSTINHQISQRGLLSQGPRVSREECLEERNDRRGRTNSQCLIPNTQWAKVPIGAEPPPPTINHQIS